MAKNEIFRLWNKNFFLLWQGSLVSFIGDMLYQFALGFWVLDKTGSTATMGLVMSAGFIPVIIVGIFAGTFVDRHDRKIIIVSTDLIRGIAVLTGGILALLNLLPVWGVLILSVIIGTCSSFFSPASGSSLPDIVPSEFLDKANSLTSMIRGGGTIIGKAMAGFLFTILGAPILFIANGVSYLLSALSESFISIPQVHNVNSQKKFREDLSAGAKYLWDHKALRFL
jgi:MFS family permease